MALKSRNVIDFDDPRVSKIGHPAPPWLVNYADLMTEMVCFFVMLYALSATMSVPTKATVDKIKEDTTKSGQSKQVDVKATQEGYRITLKEIPGGAPLFVSGSADLTPEIIKLLSIVGASIQSSINNPDEKKKMKNEILVEGHTDDVPINTPQFPSNWELSAARATNVVKYMVANFGIPPVQISAIGYGEYRPIKQAQGEAPESWRSHCRRVVFLIKGSPPKVEEGSEPEQAKEEKE